LEQSI
jgi:hypothetical protein